MPANTLDFYQDIYILPNPEIAPHCVMEKVFSKLHVALVQLGSQKIGVSFPEHDNSKPSLGRRLRLHGAKADLQNLVLSNWIGQLDDYLSFEEITPTPNNCQYCIVSRVQAKSNVDRLRRRAMRRHGFNEAEARKAIPDTASERLILPFIMTSSASTRQSRFPLFISHKITQGHSMEGGFNAYGLSIGAAIPWF